MKRSRVPSVVKRNTLYLAVSQAVYQCVGQAIFILAALVVLAATGSPTLAGLATAVIWGGRVLIVYQTGKLMDRIGRKTVLIIGIGLASLSSLLMGWGVFLGNLGFFWFGLLIYGFGSGVTNQARVAVADMYPVERRGEGIGYLLTGNVVGSLLSPLYTIALIPFAASFAVDLNGVILLVSTAVLALSSLLLVAIKPDTREIARNLHDYYPNMESTVHVETDRLQSNSLSRAILFLPVLAGFVASALATGDMSMMMSLVSVVMHEHDVVLTLISLAVTLHVLGMYGLSVPLGRLTDRMGRRLVTVLGALVLGVGALLMPLTTSYLIMTFAIFLVGLGWSAANVATTALISDFTPPERRGRLLGANDVAIGLAALSLPVLGGAVIANAGLLALGLLGLAVAVPALLIVLPLHEIKPGVYTNSPPLDSGLNQSPSQT